MRNIKNLTVSNNHLGHSLDPLLQIGPFVPVPKGYLSRFWNRDKAAGTKGPCPPLARLAFGPGTKAIFCPGPKDNRDK